MWEDTKDLIWTFCSCFRIFFTISKSLSTGFLISIRYAARRFCTAPLGYWQTLWMLERTWAERRRAKDFVLHLSVSVSCYYKIPLQFGGKYCNFVPPFLKCINVVSQHNEIVHVYGWELLLHEMRALAFFSLELHFSHYYYLDFSLEILQKWHDSICNVNFPPQNGVFKNFIFHFSHW